MCTITETASWHPAPGLSGNCGYEHPKLRYQTSSNSIHWGRIRLAVVWLIVFSISCLLLKCRELYVWWAYFLLLLVITSTTNTSNIKCIMYWQVLVLFKLLFCFEQRTCFMLFTKQSGSIMWTARQNQPNTITQFGRAWTLTYWHTFVCLH